MSCRKLESTYDMGSVSSYSGPFLRDSMGKGNKVSYEGYMGHGE